LYLELFCLKRLERFERLKRFERKKWSSSHGETPAAAALAGAESFAAAARRATVGSGIFPALLN
jgi:hypothetical protein